MPEEHLRNVTSSERLTSSTVSIGMEGDVQEIPRSKRLPFFYIGPTEECLFAVRLI